MGFPSTSILRVTLANGLVFDLAAGQTVLTANGYKRDNLLGQPVMVSGAPISGTDTDTDNDSNLTITNVVYQSIVISVTDLAVPAVVTGLTFQVGAETLQNSNSQSNYQVF